MEAKLRELASKLKRPETLAVGFLETAKYADGLSVAQVAYWNEFGTKTSPPRPFFRGMIAKDSPAWGNRLTKILLSVNYDINLTLIRMGGTIINELQDSIIEFADPPNAASTIAKKGFNKPLIDSGDMQRKVQAEVIDK